MIVPTECVGVGLFKCVFDIHHRSGLSHAARREEEIEHTLLIDGGMRGNAACALSSLRRGVVEKAKALGALKNLELF